MEKILTIADHSRYFKNCTYIYPVVSRRSNGISLGINLNLNNACNWRCVYCQVEGLIRGKPNPIDLVKLEFELDQMLDWIINGDFIQQFAPINLRRFNDICLAGNGEPTLSVDFVAVCEIIAKLRLKYQLAGQVKTILITNGSEMHKLKVQSGLRLIAENNGEVWFKIDRGTQLGIQNVNQVGLSLLSVVQHLKTSASLCLTQVQSCWFAIGKIEPSLVEVEEFVSLVVSIKSYISGVLLYSTARNPALAEGATISQVSELFMLNLKAKLESHGIKVKSYL